MGNDQVNQQQEEKYNIDDEDDEFIQECTIDPGKDRRQAIHSSPHNEHAIIKCIGSLRILYNQVTNPPEFAHGSGTVIKIDNSNRCYVLTAAHNARAKLRICPSCQTKTLKRTCKCKKMTKKIIPETLIAPDSIQFQRRCIKHKEKQLTFGQIEKAYDIVDIRLREKLYKQYSGTHDGYDICIMIFKCNDKDGIDIYRTNSATIELIYDCQLGSQHNAVMHVYGYPAQKSNVINNERQYEMWGMSTSPLKSHTITVDKNKKNAKLFIRNPDIDTTAGQSGSSIYSQHHQDENIYMIYGIHTGGSAGSVVKKTLGWNCGTLLDRENLVWIQQQIQNIKVNIIDSESDILVKRLVEEMHNVLQKNNRSKIEFMLYNEFYENDIELHVPAERYLPKSKLNHKIAEKSNIKEEILDMQILADAIIKLSEMDEYEPIIEVRILGDKEIMLNWMKPLLSDNFKGLIYLHSIGHLTGRLYGMFAGIEHISTYNTLCEMIKRNKMFAVMLGFPGNQVCGYSWPEVHECYDFTKKKWVIDTSKLVNAIKLTNTLKTIILPPVSGFYGDEPCSYGLQELLKQALVDNSSVTNIIAINGEEDVKSFDVSKPRPKVNWDKFIVEDLLNKYKEWWPKIKQRNEKNVK
eukprot:154027_1